MSDARRPRCLSAARLAQVAYNKRDLILYAIGIGATHLRYVYEDHEDFAAFPTYPIVLSFKGDDQDVVSFPSPAMIRAGSFPPLPGTKVGLDGERYIERIRSIDPEGAKELHLKSRLIGVHKRGSGGLVEQESLLTDTRGTPYYRMVSGSFLVGAKNFTDSGITMSRKVPLPHRRPDRVVEETTSVYQAHTYRLSGDYNALHVDPSFAKMSGFGKPILHGLCTMGFSARAVLNAYADGDAERFKALKVRFASPVLPGQTLQVNMWKEGARVLFVTKVKETGKTVINNAYMDLHPASSL